MPAFAPTLTLSIATIPTRRSTLQSWLRRRPGVFHLLRGSPVLCCKRVIRPRTLNHRDTQCPREDDWKVVGRPVRFRVRAHSHAADGAPLLGVRLAGRPRLPRSMTVTRGKGVREPHDREA